MCMRETEGEREREKKRGREREREREITMVDPETKVVCDSST